MANLKPTSLENALKLIENSFGGQTLPTEIKDLDLSLGKICASDVFATCDIPSFNRSTVDGYAVKSSDIFGATVEKPIVLKVVGQTEMGKTSFVNVEQLQCVYVPTGGMIPDDCDTMVMLEDCDRLNAGNVAIKAYSAPRSYMIFKGDDAKFGDKLIAKGKKITTFDVGILVANGVNEIEVFKQLTFCLISTGDEIIDTNQVAQASEIYDVNGHVLCALLRQAGCFVYETVIVKDDFNAIKAAIEKGLQTCDAVILTGGSSVGEKDYTFDILNGMENSDVLIHGLNLKPGKPTIVANVGNKPVFGLPGHPVSAVIVFRLIIMHYLNMLTSQLNEPPITQTIVAKMAAESRSVDGKLTCQIVNVKREKNCMIAYPVSGMSGLISLLAKADGFVMVQCDEKINAGDVVFVQLF